MLRSSTCLRGAAGRGRPASLQGDRVATASAREAIGGVAQRFWRWTAIIQIEMAVNSGKWVEDPQRRPNLALVRVLHPLRADEPLDIPACYIRRAITHKSKMRPAIAVFERVFQQPKSRADGD